MNEDKNPVKLAETYTVKKYDGDAPKPGEIKEPVEIIAVYSDGRIERKVK